jgi:hypothetical protein
LGAGQLHPEVGDLPDVASPFLDAGDDTLRPVVQIVAVQVVEELPRLTELALGEQCQEDSARLDDSLTSPVLTALDGPQ